MKSKDRNYEGYAFAKARLFKITFHDGFNEYNMDFLQQSTLFPELYQLFEVV